MTDTDFLAEVPWIMDKWYQLWCEHTKRSLKYPQEIVSFIDSCGFTCEQLHRIIQDLEDLKWSDYEDNRPDDFDRSDELREQRWEFDN